MNYNIRPANPDDAAVILSLIFELAKYEKLTDEVVATPEKITETLFGEKPVAQGLLAEKNEGERLITVGLAIYFHNYSTFLGQPGIYLEDLFVLPEHRGEGIGKALLKRVSQQAVEQNCGRMEWSVLDWNQPAIDFYESLDAVPMNQWITYRLTGEALMKLGAQ